MWVKKRGNGVYMGLIAYDCVSEFPLEMLL